MIGIDKINQAVSILVEHASPEKIILFGSYANGNPQKDSDIDLFIVESKLKNKHKETVRLRRALSPLRIPVDIVVHGNKALKNWGHIPGTLIYNILKEGKILYEKT